MSKILLVEDDNNLREIYDARLQAEGYDIVSASDGEEALVVAKREHPDLIISDVMMPKISGFEMLDILRNAEDLRDVKVIMLTALGQAEDQKRADSLGADRYLVKSQVTLEDIVRVSQELLSGADAATTAQAAAVAEAPPAPEAPAASPAPAPEPTPVATAPVTVEPEPVSQTASEPLPPVAAPEIPVATAPETPDEPVEASPHLPPTPASTVPEAAVTADTPQTSAQEEKTVEDQIADFISNQSGEPIPAADTSAPESITVATPPVESAAGKNEPEQEKSVADALSSLGEESLNAPAKTPAATPATATEEPATEPEAAPPSAPHVKRSMVAVAPPVQPNEDTAVTEPAPATTPPKADNENDDEDDVPVHHSKVIQPLSSEEQSPKKSLDELLAEEDAKDSGVALPTPATPPVSLNAKTPAAEPAIPEAPTEITPDMFSTPETGATADEAPTAPADASKPKTDFDPNSVAL